MKDITRELIKSAAPNWLVAVLMGICVFYLKRSVDQMDSVANVVRQSQTSIAVMESAIDKHTIAIGTIDQICRNLEVRLVRLETATQDRTRN